MTHPPRISNFSGNEPKSGDTTYELWKQEVKLLMKQSYEKEAILNAVRRSLRGEAGYAAMRLDLDASVEEVIHKLDSIYGNVDKKEELLAEFYGSRQKEDETVTSWSCRLESLMGQAVERGIVGRQDVDGMLHSMLWTGLRTSLKDISGHKYDTIKEFDSLRVALRQIENDHMHREVLTKSSKPQTSKAAIEQSDAEDIKGMIQQMTTRMDRYEKKLEKQEPTQQQQPPWQQQQQPPWQQQSTWQQQQQPPWQQQSTWQQHQQPRWQQQRGRGRGRGQQQTHDEPQCWRCGQTGHYKRGCGVRMDHSRKDLNGKKPIRLPRDIIEINTDTIRTICNSVTSVPYAECLAVNPDILQDDIDLNGTSTSDIIDWKRAQRQDTVVSHWIDMIQKDQKPEKGDAIFKRQSIRNPDPSNKNIIDVLLEPFVEDDSDSTVTSDIIQPVVNPTSDVEIEDESESEGDAHSHDTNGTDSDIGDRRPSPEVTSDNQEDSSDSSSSSSPVSIRRSTRARKAPAWMTSGKYELSKSASHTTTTDWFQRVQCLTSLADTHLFHGKQAEAAQAIIDVITTATTDRK
ncbi:unnamed protein product [Mytilus edulis]|uniref:CCHC-type domain-containing protein n=1 Tax=Mytilus edulis TaxID=6550 RepID=A0A8S3QHN5_MYTED|nr:unnamed protein product [Mytilus edulis]